MYKILENYDPNIENIISSKLNFDNLMWIKYTIYMLILQHGFGRRHAKC